MRDRITPATADLQPGDTVLYYRPTTVDKEGAPSKWSSAWEGPYRVLSKCGENSYRLTSLGATTAKQKLELSHRVPAHRAHLYKICSDEEEMIQGPDVAGKRWDVSQERELGATLKSYAPATGFVPDDNCWSRASAVIRGSFLFYVSASSHIMIGRCVRPGRLSVVVCGIYACGKCVDERPFV